MIRIAALIMILGWTVSCRTSKEITPEQPKPETSKETSQTNGPVTETYYLGEVQLLDCGAVIQVSSGESKSICSPVNLDPKFRVDKLRLKLKYKVLDEKATTCSEFTAIEVIEAFAVR